MEKVPPVTAASAREAFVTDTNLFRTNSYTTGSSVGLCSARRTKRSRTRLNTHPSRRAVWFLKSDEIWENLSRVVGRWWSAHCERTRVWVVEMRAPSSTAVRTQCERCHGRKERTFHGRRKGWRFDSGPHLGAVSFCLEGASPKRGVVFARWLFRVVTRPPRRVAPTRSRHARV